MNQTRKNRLRNFALGSGLTLISFLVFGCALTKALRHPFTPPAEIVQALPSPPPAPAPFSILHPLTTTAAQPQSAPAVPVRLASGQTVLMTPVSSPIAPAASYAPTAAPVKTPVAKAIDYLLWLIWIGGLLAIAAGVACIVWLQQLWLGIKLIGCSVGAIIIGTWFAFHYVAIVTISLIGLIVWIVFDHLITWSAVRKWIEKEQQSLKKNL